MGKVSAIICAEMHPRGVIPWGGETREEPTGRAWWAFWRPRTRVVVIPPLEERITASLVGAGGDGRLTRETRVVEVGSHRGHEHYVYSMERAG